MKVESFPSWTWTYPSSYRLVVKDIISNSSIFFLFIAIFSGNQMRLHISSYQWSYYISFIILLNLIFVPILTIIDIIFWYIFIKYIFFLRQLIVSFHPIHVAIWQAHLTESFPFLNGAKRMIGIENHWPPLGPGLVWE